MRATLGKVATVELVFLIPILAIAGGIVKSVLQSQERQLQMRLMSQRPVAAPPPTDQQMQSVIAEISRVRDTSTQYCLSLEHTVTRLEQRIERLESRLSSLTIVPSPGDPMSGEIRYDSNVNSNGIRQSVGR